MRFLARFTGPYRVVCVGVVLAMPGRAWSLEDEAAFFESRIRPVLLEHCVSCHGAEKRKSDLRLDTGKGLFRGGSRGSAVLPGNPGESLLYQSISGTGELEMPPDGPLSEQQTDDIRQWIANGAQWPDYDPSKVAEPSAPDPVHHWAFQPVTMPEVPELPDSAWVQTPVDAFVLHSMLDGGLAPSAKAQKETLLRRVTLDVIGLPPTPEELTDFAADDSTGAYYRVVERLLGSPQYGERWARHWLDVVRYTDSFDSRASTVTDPAEIWRYRDWVVNAFNNDMPYDDFLRYQIAGDLMPAADGGFNRDGLIATGVLAIGNWPQGDADKEKMVCDIVDDQIDLVTRGFMGLTLSCARCHDHKFEPFTTEDYYGLAGIFFSSSILPGPGAKTEGSPILHLPLASKEELAERAAREQRLADLRTQRDTLLQEERRAFALEALEHSADYILAALGLELPRQGNATGLLPDAVRKWQVWLGLQSGVLNALSRDVNGITGLHSRRGVKDMPSAVANMTGKEQHYATITQPADSIIVHPSPDKPAIVAWQSPASTTLTISARLTDVDPTCGNGLVYRLQQVTGAETRLLAEGVVENAAAAPITLSMPVAVVAGDQLVLEVDPRGDYSCDSTMVEWTLQSDAGERWDFHDDVYPHFLDAGPWPDAHGHPDVWFFADPNELATNSGLQDELRPLVDASKAGASDPIATLQFAMKLHRRLTARTETGAPVEPQLIAELTSEQGPFWLDNPPLAEGSLRKTVEDELRSLETNPLPTLDLAVGIQEGAVPGTVYTGFTDVRVHRRGDYNNLGDLVPRRMPEILAGNEQSGITEGSGRRELADWVASASNPLTARVMVNRIWQHYFGEGIVRTPGDFGTRGDKPTHPELLDYLAHEFLASGWSMKAIHRLILLSSTYQQTSTGNEESLVHDPENRLFARMNRKRMEAEVLRDSVLAVSNQLDLERGGPAFADLNLPRRTLYLKTNRSDRTTYAMLFDAADPTSIMPKRVEATVAPQALFLMNHPFMETAAKTLAQSAMATGLPIEDTVHHLYARLYGRVPSEREVAVALEYLRQTGEDDNALTESYCHALLCANEFVFVD